MGYTFRTDGAWGTGVGRDLFPAEVDSNFWQAIQDITAKAAQGVGISNFVVNGNQFTVVLTDHTLLGPYTLPVMQIRFGGEWLPNTAYLAGTIITHGGSTYFINVNHTSAATFDPGANDGHGNDFYGLLLQNPALTIPLGGAIGAFLRKTGTADYVMNWQGAILEDLSDVQIGSPLEGQALIYLHGVWQNASAVASLAGLTDVSISGPVTNHVLTWTGTNWANNFTFLSKSGDVVLTSPVGGQGLFYNGSNNKWVNASAFDMPVYDMGNVSGSIIIDFGTSQFIEMTMQGNTTVSSFTMPAVGMGTAMRRVINVFNTGAYTLTWPNFIKWPGGAIPSVTPGAGPIGSGASNDMFVMHSDNGVTLYGSIVGQNYS
jgi:hypothetical protein